VAVKPSEPLVRNYWPRFHKRAVFQTVFMQVIVVGAIGGALAFAELSISPLELTVVLVAVLAASIGLNIVLVNQLTLPLRDLTSALTRASGEPTTLAAPNPNAKRFTKDGFKPVLQTVYELGSKNEHPLHENSFDVPDALNHASAGIVMLDATRTVIFANKAAPIRRDTDNIASLELLFTDHPTLDEWIDICNEKSVQAERTWLRVPNKPIGEEGRKIYDLTASYDKGSKAEVIVTLLERTKDYQPEDDSLDFIAFAAHELRGPITVIRGYLDVLDDELQDVMQGDQAELMKRLIVSSNRLSSYVNNILNASRYDRRHLKIRLHEEDIKDIYDSIQDDMQLRAAAQNRMLSVHFPDTLPTVAADKASIGEVLGNLIDNAIKYSNEGGVVNVSAKQDGDFVKIAVQDYGIGMPSNVVSNLFHKFYRSHRSRETVAGTGIGLYICKAIVESHGGTISVKSREGEGSVFEFSLPVYATVAEKLKANHNTNEGLIEHGEGWIKNHAMFRG